MRAYLLASLALLAPCYWQARIQAGDLSSHIYNAWLVQLIERGQASGLTTVFQTTNVLFDLMLNKTFQWFGPDAAQRICVSLSVLVLVWGAFAFLGAVAGRRPWRLLPAIAMLAYGWVFHMGFFNFHLSMGLCLWALAVAWPLKASRLAPAAGLLVLAFAAHALAVVWAVAVLGYVWVARRVGAERRWWVTGSVLLLMGCAHLAARSYFAWILWLPKQWTFILGADQLWVYDGKYYVVVGALALVEGRLAFRVWRALGSRGFLGSEWLHLCVIGAAAICLVPNTVLLPGYAHSLAFIAERMSLALAIGVLALVATAAPGRLETATLMGAALVFIGFVYHDQHAINLLEDRMRATVATLPPGQRVVSMLADRELRIDPLSHLADRVCVGHCYSYANYEPSTQQFRVRAVQPNGIVTADFTDSFRMQLGEYVFQERDLPAWAVDVEPSGRMVLRPLTARVRTGASLLRALEDTPPW